MTPPIKVVVIDDDALVRAGLALVLGGDERLRVVAEGEDGSVALPLVRKHGPDVVLMDLRMPGIDGVTATSQLAKHFPGVRVIVLTTIESDEAIAAALRAGASGYVLKDDSALRLGQAIVDVHEGVYALSPAVTARFVERVTAAERSEHRDRSQALLAKLTVRELDVANAVALGQSNAEVAAATHLSIPTVKGHISSIMSKTGATNRVQIALLVHQRQ